MGLLEGKKDQDLVVWFTGCRSSPDWCQRTEKIQRAAHFPNLSVRVKASRQRAMASFFHVGCHQLIPDVVKSTTKRSLHRSFEDFCCWRLLLDVEIELLMLACYCMQPYVGSSYLDSDSTIVYQVRFPLRHLSKLHSPPPPLFLKKRQLGKLGWQRCFYLSLKT